MKFEIKRARNGWILTCLDDEDSGPVVGAETTDEHEAFAAFLREITVNYGPSDSKYSVKRIVVMIMPGLDYDGPLDPEYRTELEFLRDHLNDVLKPAR